MKKLLLLSLLGIGSMAMSMDLSSLVGQCASVDKRLVITDNFGTRRISVTSVNSFKKNRVDCATIIAVKTDGTDTFKFVAQVSPVNSGGEKPCWKIEKIMEVVQE